MSAKRLLRLRDNLKRVHLDAEIITADIITWQPGQKFDAVLLDAPCSSTGTMRRHPDMIYLKSQQDIKEMALIQAKLLSHISGMLKPGGIFIYCTCSLEPEEGEEQIANLIKNYPAFKRLPITADEIDGAKTWITKQGDIRTLPCYHLPANQGLTGMDGFFIARMQYQ